MNTCKTCKWWNGANQKNSYCGLPMLEQFTFEPGGYRIPADAVYAVDRGGDVAGLLTGPDFGCVHHEAKE